MRLTLEELRKIYFRYKSKIEFQSLIYKFKKPKKGQTSLETMRFLRRGTALGQATHEDYNQLFKEHKSIIK